MFTTGSLIESHKALDRHGLPRQLFPGQAVSCSDFSACTADYADHRGPGPAVTIDPARFATGRRLPPRRFLDVGSALASNVAASSRMATCLTQRPPPTLS